MTGLIYMKQKSDFSDLKLYLHRISIIITNASSKNIKKTINQNWGMTYALLVKSPEDTPLLCRIKLSNNIGIFLALFVLGELRVRAATNYVNWIVCWHCRVKSDAWKYYLGKLSPKNSVLTKYYKDNHNCYCDPTS